VHGFLRYLLTKIVFSTIIGNCFMKVRRSINIHGINLPALGSAVT
jgi:hypothetical protein